MRTKKLRDIEEKERRRELKKRQKRKAREISEKRRPRNREYTLVSCFFVLIFVSMIGYLIYFNYAKSDDFINSPYNTRQDTFSDRVVRGKIISADGQVLAQYAADKEEGALAVAPDGQLEKVLGLQAESGSMDLHI